MSTISIRLRSEQLRYRPGDTIIGTVAWTTERPPAAVEMRLFWFTSGVSPQQVGVASRLAIPAPTSVESREFEFVLPEKPWSFQGRLVALTWALEAVVLPTRICMRCLITIGPGGESLALHKRTASGE
jgi:hypothetical protein